MKERDQHTIENIPTIRKEISFSVVHIFNMLAADLIQDEVESFGHSILLMTYNTQYHNALQQRKQLKSEFLINLIMDQTQPDFSRSVNSGQKA